MRLHVMFVTKRTEVGYKLLIFAYSFGEFPELINQLTTEQFCWDTVCTKIQCVDSVEWGRLIASVSSFTHEVILTKFVSQFLKTKN